MTRLVRESDITGFDSAELIDVPAIRPCDLCGETDSLDTPGDPSGKIRICASCGFVHVKERRSVQEVAQAWEQIYASGVYDPNWAGVKARLWYVAEWIDQNIGLARKTILDIGAGNGLFLDYCRDRIVRGTFEEVQKFADESWRYWTVALDPSPENIAKIQRSTRGHGTICGWAADSSPDIGQFDIVTLNWTLENVGSCLEVLRYAKRQLKPDGHVVVATGSRIGCGFKKPLSSYIPQDPGYPHDTHCFRWSIQSLINAGKKCGLYIVKRNDWKERDEMIVVFDTNESSAAAIEDARAVYSHFINWRHQCP